MKARSGLKPRPFHLSPVRQRNGRWSYPFALLLIGEQLRCPLNDGESTRRGAQRCLTAAKCWTKEVGWPSRRRMQFRSRQFPTFILLERWH